MANDFSGDANCVALWKFDNDATDSIGGNDLTAVNTPTYDSGDKKEGTHSADLEESSAQYFTIADGDLDANFPGKNGTSEQSFSIGGWVKVESFDDYLTLASKYDAGSGARSYAVSISTGGVVFFRLGYNGGASYTNLSFGTALSTGKWYHIAATYDSSDNSMKIRVWDDDAGALLGTNATGTAGGDMSPDTAPLEIGRFNLTNNADGKIDEVVIFKDVLSDNEIDMIRQATYPHLNISTDVPLATASAACYEPAFIRDAKPEIPLATAQAAGYTPALIRDSIPAIPLATASAAGLLPSVGIGAIITVPLATASAAGHVPTVILGSTITVPLATATAAGYAPEVAISIIFDIPLATAEAACYEPDLILDAIIAIPLGTATAACYEPAFIFGMKIYIPLATATAEGYAPAFVRDAVIAIPLGEADAAGLVPSVIVNPDTGQVYKGYLITAIHKTGRLKTSLHKTGRILTSKHKVGRIITGG